MPPFIIERDGKPFATIEDDDSVIFFNFRGDRSIQISKCFTHDEVPIERVRVPKVVYAGMMQYDGDEQIPELYLVKPPAIDKTLSEYLSTNGVFQIACSETQKYGHVTYFWNGNKSGYIDEPKEIYVEIPSDTVPFEQRPWMKAAEVTDETIKLLSENPNCFCRINYPNGDMVGHTGVMESARIAVETVDLCLGRLLETIKELGGIAFVTADHGNADEMFEKAKDGSPKMSDGKPKSKTSHTLNPVPFIIYDPAFDGEYELSGVESPGLANIAATALTLLGINPPEIYEPSLVKLK